MVIGAKPDRGVGSAKSRQAILGLARSEDAELKLSLRRSPSMPLRQRPGRASIWRVSDQLYGRSRRIRVWNAAHHVHVAADSSIAFCQANNRTDQQEAHEEYGKSHRCKD